MPRNAHKWPKDRQNGGKKTVHCQFASKGRIGPPDVAATQRIAIPSVWVFWDFDDPARRCSPKCHSHFEWARNWPTLLLRISAANRGANLFQTTAIRMILGRVLSSRKGECFVILQGFHPQKGVKPRTSTTPRSSRRRSVGASSDQPRRRANIPDQKGCFL